MKKKYEVVSSQLLDTETGEIIDAKDVEDAHVAVVEKGGYVRQLNQIEYYREMERRYQDRTPYIRANFTYGSPYFPQIKDTLISILIFFATFCNDSGYCMRSESIKETLKIDYNQVKDFRDTLTQQGIVSIRNGKAYVSSSAFYRGILKDEGKDFIRIFIEANQQLFLSCTVNQHKKLSYIYRMIPYVNRQTNILSYNQQEQNLQYIEKMTIKEFCEIVGYNSSHSSRLRKELLSFRIYGELVVGFFDDIYELNPNGEYVVVNPKLFYGGEREKKSHIDICKLFEVEKDTFVGAGNKYVVNSIPIPMKQKHR